jgi:hypothetical protein
LTEDRAIVAQMLSAIRRDLTLTVQPELHSPQARVKAMMINDMLGHLVAWHREEPDNLDERRRYAAHFAMADADRTRSVEHLQALEVEVTPARLEAFLKARMPAWADAGVENVSRVAAGYSKDTFFFRAVRPDGAALDGVIRRDLPFGPGENTVLDEFELLRALHAQGLPIAEPLAREPDKSWLGQPFMISRRMAGTDGTEPWDRDEGLGAASACKWRTYWAGCTASTRRWWARRPAGRRPITSAPMCWNGRTAGGATAPTPRRPWNPPSPGCWTTCRATSSGWPSCIRTWASTTC